MADALSRRYRIGEVVSSPLERAVETARFIADAQGADVCIDQDLSEIDIGSWTGRTFAELLQADEWQRYNELRSTSRPPGGEFMMQVQSRAWSSLRRIAERHQAAEESTIAVVTHGDVIRALLVLFLGMPLDHIHRLEVAPASVSEVQLASDHPHVRNINEQITR